MIQYDMLETVSESKKILQTMKKIWKTIFLPFTPLTKVTELLSDI